MVDIPALWMFPALFVLVFLGFPVAFSMIALSFVFGFWFFGDTLGPQMFSQLHSVATNYVLTALPLFVFMGAALERSGIAEKLFIAIQLWIGKLRGGLALTSISMCGVFAACSGVVGAVETVVGMMAIPPMVKQRYKHDLISGTICAGGSLGTIIPPTVVVVVYGSIVEQSIGDLFAGVVIPGLLMTVLFLGYIIIRCYLRPEDAPAVDDGSQEDVSLGHKLSATMIAIVPGCRGSGFDPGWHRLADRGRGCRRARRRLADCRLWAHVRCRVRRRVDAFDQDQRDGHVRGDGRCHVLQYFSGQWR